MIVLALTPIICLFSVVIPIQSGEIIYVYDYDNFGDIFPQGDGVNDFHISKYSDIDNIFDKKYEGPHIGGAYLVEGKASITTREFEGYVKSVTVNYYCGNTEWPGDDSSLWISVDYAEGGGDYVYLCDRQSWENYTWIPQYRDDYQGFTFQVKASEATIDRAFGFDEIRISTTKKPPQLLQRDNNTSNNNHQKNTSNNNLRKNTSNNNHQKNTSNNNLRKNTSNKDHQKNTSNKDHQKNTSNKEPWNKISRTTPETLMQKVSNEIWHNYVPEKMIHGEIRPRIKDNTVCKTKLENIDPLGALLSNRKWTNIIKQEFEIMWPTIRI